MIQHIGGHLCCGAKVFASVEGGMVKIGETCKVFPVRSRFFLV